MEILVLGIGNRILRDDGAGPAVIEELRGRSLPPNVSCLTSHLSGMPLLDLVVGWRALIVVDACQSGGTPGDVRWLDLQNIELRDNYLSSQHKVGILQAVELGRSLGLTMPSSVHILAVEAGDTTSFGEGLTPAVALAVPIAARMVMVRLAGLMYTGYRPATAGGGGTGHDESERG